MIDGRPYRPPVCYSRPLSSCAAREARMPGADSAGARSRARPGRHRGASASAKRITGISRTRRRSMKIGFIGLGMMGRGMAANLQKAGHQLIVHDIRRAAAEPYLAKGAIWADSPKAVGEQSEVVF